MKRISLFLLLLLLSTIAPIHAQTAAWEVIVAAAASPGAWNIIRITQDGSQPPIPVPEGAIYARAITEDMILSPDIHYFVVGQRSDDFTSVFPPRIADLKTGAVYDVTIPRGTPAAYSFSGFDPSMNRFALSAVYEVPNVGVEGLFGVVDAATGTFTEIIDHVPAGDFALPGWFRLGAWDADGIHVYPNCYGCEPPLEGEYAAYNPDTGTYTTNTGELFSAFGEQLPLTGEWFARAYSTDYPFSTEPAAYFPYPNVLVYKPSAVYLPTYPPESNEHTASAESPVIYHDPNLVDLGLLDFEWVQDGQYILIDGDPRWTLLDRAGGQHPLEAFTQAYRVVGTPDGWISFETFTANSSYIRRYWYENGLTYEDAFGEIPGTDARLLYATPLGTSASPIPAAFTPIQPNFAQLEAIMLSRQMACPGFMPSRLFPGQQGRVTPGEPNNVRNLPARSGEIAGRVPGGAVFDILSGPTCGDNIAWWYIRYGDLYGYMAEGVGSEYFTELVRP